MTPLSGAPSSADVSGSASSQSAVPEPARLPAPAPASASTAKAKKPFVASRRGVSALARLQNEAAKAKSAVPKKPLSGDAPGAGAMARDIAEANTPRAAPAPKPLRPPMTPVTRAFNHFCSHALNYGVASEAQLAAMVEAVGACESEDQREAEQLRLLEEGLRGADVRSHTRT